MASISSRLGCLRRCGLSIREMQHDVRLCLRGEASIPERKVILAERRKALEEEMARLQSAQEYLGGRQAFYDEVLAGRRPCVSNLLPKK